MPEHTPGIVTKLVVSLDRKVPGRWNVMVERTGSRPGDTVTSGEHFDADPDRPSTAADIQTVASLNYDIKGGEWRTATGTVYVWEKVPMKTVRRGRKKGNGE